MLTRKLESREVDEECSICGEVTERALFNVLTNVMYIECDSCGTETTVVDWYDDWVKEEK